MADEVARHPVIGTIKPNVVTNEDILGLPENERSAWIHGAVTLMAQTAASQQVGNARCVMDWYFSGSQTHELIINTMREYPQERAASTLFGLAKITCTEL